MPHLGHAFVTVEVMADALTGVAIGVLTISSRSGNGCVGSVVIGVGADVHSVCAIDPDVPSNA